MEEDVRDFKLFDEDFEEFLRLGRKAFGIGEYNTNHSIPLPAPATNEEGEGSYGDHSQGSGPAAS